MIMPISTTYRGVAIMLMAYVLRAVGQELPDQQLANFVDTLLVISGAVMALYGRYKAGGIHWTGAKHEVVVAPAPAKKPRSKKA
jgi:hypothetical protein